MKLKLFTFFLVIFWLSANKSFSQSGTDTILFINGTTVITAVTEIVKATDSTEGLVSFVNPKKTKKIKTVDSDRIFSITNSKGESLIYNYDTLDGNEMTVDEMRYFIRGQQDARKVIKGWGGMSANFLLSLGAGATGSFLTPVVPFAVAGLLGLPSVKTKKGSVSNPEYLSHDAYLEGYEREGKRKRKVKSLLGGTVGLVLGLGASIVLKANGDELIK
jgi:hypothetical protein